jgi:hypothetical protein
MSAMEMFTVVASWDETENVWVGRCAEVRALAEEAESLDALMKKLIDKTADAVVSGALEVDADSVYIQIVAHRHVISRA